MTTSYLDILTGITKAVDSIPGKFEVESQDIEEGFKRPSFFIEMDTTPSDFMKSIKERDITIRLIYFPKDKHKNQMELLEMMDKIEKKFIEENYIEISPETEERDQVLVEVNNPQFTNKKDILQFQFDIQLDELYERPENPNKIEEFIME